jgi:hypothetical protein
VSQNFHGSFKNTLERRYGKRRAQYVDRSGSHAKVGSSLGPRISEEVGPGRFQKFTSKAAAAARQNTGVRRAIEASGNFRFGAHYGLRSDIAPCPKSATEGDINTCLLTT